MQLLFLWRPTERKWKTSKSAWFRTDQSKQMHPWHQREHTHTQIHIHGRVESGGEGEKTLHCFTVGHWGSSEGLKRIKGEAKDPVSLKRHLKGRKDLKITAKDQVNGWAEAREHRHATHCHRENHSLIPATYNLQLSSTKYHEASTKWSSKRSEKCTLVSLVTLHSSFTLFHWSPLTLAEFEHMSTHSLLISVPLRVPTPLLPPISSLNSFFTLTLVHRKVKFARVEPTRRGSVGHVAENEFTHFHEKKKALQLSFAPKAWPQAAPLLRWKYPLDKWSSSKYKQGKAFYVESWMENSAWPLVPGRRSLN